MCNCITEITESMQGKTFNNKTVRSVTFLQPRIRLRFKESSKPADIGIEPNSCPWCDQFQDNIQITLEDIKDLIAEFSDQTFGK